MSERILKYAEALEHLLEMHCPTLLSKCNRVGRDTDAGGRKTWV